MRRRQLLALLVLCGLMLPALPAQAKVKVTATLPDLAAIAMAVGGDEVEVTSLASPKIDPHYVDPRPSLVIQLARADLLILNGLELEASWLDPLLTQSRNARIQSGAPGYLDASTLVELMQVPGRRIDRSMGDLHPGGNPHFTFDPRRGASIAVGVGERLAAIDPSKAETYRTRANAYAGKLLALASEQAARFRALPDDKRRVVAYHRSLAYLEDWLGLEEVITVEPKPGIPPDPGHVARVLKTMKAKSVNVIVQESYYPANTSRTLAKLTKGHLVVLDGGTELAKGDTYEARVRRLADSLFGAIDG
jgi:zinc/manganese transport system substrate-binding protein